jgi:phage tail sheath protein FI
MPVNPTYPGVYIEEVPSGVRTITGVATSITAFIGRTLRGPVDEPITINGYADFERVFGGLWTGSTLGYAVRDFYMNGGSQAIVVRLFSPTEGDQAKAQTAADGVAVAAAGADGNTAAGAARTAADAIKNDATKSQAEKDAAEAVAKAAEDIAKAAVAGGDATGGPAAAVTQAATNAAKTAVPVTSTPVDVAGLTLEAAYPGSWGEYLRLIVDVNVSQEYADSVGLAKDKFFNLEIIDAGPNGRSERFNNLTFEDKDYRIDRVLEAESRLVRWRGTAPSGSLPAPIVAAHAAPKEEDKIIYDDVLKAERALSAKILDDPITDHPAEKKAVADAKAKLETSDGNHLDKTSFTGPGMQAAKQGLYALENADLFNILSIPPYLTTGNVDPALVAAAAVYCEERRAMLLVDPPKAWDDKDKAKQNVGNLGTRSKNAALYFPRLCQPDPLRNDRIDQFVPSGAVAGIFARTDRERGVWKAPAGLDATLVGVPEVSVPLTDAQNGELNPLGVNCLRARPAAGNVVWGARTLQGDDRLASEWKYVPVRRTALFIEESLYRGTQWVVFEPNDEPLWAQIRLNIGAFMHNLFRQGAFQGLTPRDAYLVKCDSETTTQNDINLGIVNILVGFAPLKPAEFVILKIKQLAGQIAV